MDTEEQLTGNNEQEERNTSVPNEISNSSNSTSFKICKCSKFKITLELFTAIVFLADSLSSSVITNIILKRTCEIHFQYNKTVCSELENKNESSVEVAVQPYVDLVLTGMNFLSLLLPAIMSLFLGSWSDHNGRKLLLIAPPTGYFLKYLLLCVFACVPSLGPSFGLICVLPVAFSGGIVNFISATYLHISDATAEDDRYFRISVLECFMYIGSLIGLSSTPYIFQAGGDNGYLLIFGLCALMVFLATLFAYFLIPESVQNTEGGKGILYLFEFKHVKQLVGMCYKKTERTKTAVIFLVIISLTATISSMEGENNVMYLFTRLKFNWDISKFTQWGSICLICGFLGNIFGAVILGKLFKIPDAFLGVLSYVTKAASSFYLAFIPRSAPHLMLYSGLIDMFGGVCGPAGRSILSKSVSKEDLGKVFALLGSCESIFPLLIAPFYTWLYNSTLHTFPGAFVVLSGIVFVISAIFYIAIWIIQKNNQTEFTRLENGDAEE